MLNDQNVNPLSEQAERMPSPTLTDLEFSYSSSEDGRSRDDGDDVQSEGSSPEISLSVSDLMQDENWEVELNALTLDELNETLDGPDAQDSPTDPEHSDDTKSATNILQKLSEIFEKCKSGTQEPWPKDVKLFQPYEVEQILLPDNASCLAVQAFLKMCSLDFQVECRANAEAMSPSGKVPFIKAGAFVISELEPIVQFINSKGITLTEKLDAEMKSDMRAYMSLVHNVMEMAELYICWCDKETYNEVTSIRHGSIYPWPLNHIQNRSKRNAVIKKLKVLGWYQKSLTEVFQEVENCCQALTDRLEGKDYFFGDKPTELDALVFGHLFTILTTPLPNSYIANTVRNYPVLINLVQKIEREYFKRETKH